MITLTHPDPVTRDSILATIQTVWPESPCTAETGHTVLSLDGPPKKLGQLIEEIRILQRQSQWPASLKFETSFGLRTLNTRTREWQSDDETIILTEKEVGVLLYLWQKKTPVTREDLLREIWQYAADADTHTIETHIYRLRQKIEPDPATPQFLVTNKDGYCLALI